MKETGAAQILTVVVISIFGCTNSSANVSISESSGTVTIQNSLVGIQFNLESGTYDAIDLRDNSLCIKDAYFQLNDFASKDTAFSHKWQVRNIKDQLGIGRTLAITSTADDLGALLFDITLYDEKGYIVLSAGINNKTDKVIQLKQIMPIANAQVFEDFNISQNFNMLDGNGGGEETAVSHGGYLHSRNNLMLTFGRPSENRSLVMGGLTYNDFEKFAEAGQSRKIKLQNTNENRKLLCYLNLPSQKTDGGKGGPQLRLLQGKGYTFGGPVNKWDGSFASVAFHEKQVILEANNLDPDKRYLLGFSWWDVDANGRIQSVAVDTGSGTNEKILLEKQSLPAWTNKEQGPEQIQIPLGTKTCVSDRMRIIFSNESDVPNAVVSEVWLYEVQGAAQITRKIISLISDSCPDNLTIKLYAKDPVGKRVDSGVRYFPKDRFYIDFMTDNPFESLEKYALNIRTAQQIDLNIYDFPTVCLWYAEHPGYGGGPAIDTSLGAVEEMERISQSGFLKYSRAAVRLVPDSYKKDNQQGWWDDEHWQRPVEPHNGSHNGVYVEPYETSRKWGQAVTKLGGIPLTYFQTCFRSEDYADAFPGHMLFNKSVALRSNSGLKEFDRDKLDAWQRGFNAWGYDYTDPDFLEHMRQVYANLRSGGIKGLMFDYPYTGWIYDDGGFEDKYYTTAMAYRKIFQLPYEGLGPECYIHERNIQQGSDITLGLVASQRIWGDTDRISPKMVSLGALRWYKNRVVVSYDMDSKNLLRAESRDELRRLLTMAYVTSGRLLLGNSFARLDKDMLHDLTRIYPFHCEPKSPRPIDAFTREVPMVYDFEVNPLWHQVTFYNPENEKETEIYVLLAGDTAFGGLGLEAGAEYHIFDFWNDKYIGRLSGSEKLLQTLRPAEARMMSVHKVVDRPQFISTNRHLMQGYLDMIETNWNSPAKQLSGKSKVVSNEPYKVVVASNGYEPIKCTADKGRCIYHILSGEDELVELTLQTTENAIVKWSITWK